MTARRKKHGGEGAGRKRGLENGGGCETRGGCSVRNCHDDKSRRYRISWWRVSKHLQHTAWPKLYFSRTDIHVRARARASERTTTYVGSGERAGPGAAAASHRSVYICRFQRVLIERTHAATLSCTLGEQYLPPSLLLPVASRSAPRRGKRSADPRPSIRTNRVEISASGGST